MDYNLEDLTDGKPIGYAVELLRLHLPLSKKPAKKQIEPVMYCDPIGWGPERCPHEGREYARIEAYEPLPEQKETSSGTVVIDLNDDIMKDYNQ